MATLVSELLESEITGAERAVCTVNVNVVEALPDALVAVIV